MAKETSKSARIKSAGDVGEPEKTSKRQTTAIFPARYEKVTMGDVRDKAYSMGLSIDGLTKKDDIIRAIQTAEGYQACFSTRTVEFCGQKGCCWREECGG